MSTVTVLPTGITTGLHWVGTAPRFQVPGTDHGRGVTLTMLVNVEQLTASVVVDTRFVKFTTPSQLIPPTLR